MPDNVARVGGRFAVGHPRFGGKRKGTASRVRDLVEQLGPSSDPIRFMLLLIRDRTYQQVTIDAAGKKKKVTVAAPLDLILDACKTTAQYLVPRLSAVAHTGEDGGGPIRTETVNLVAIMESPELLRQAQSLSLAITEVEGGPQPAIPSYAGLLDAGEQDKE
jgi:hypothetical protein